MTKRIGRTTRGVLAVAVSLGLVTAGCSKASDNAETGLPSLDTTETGEVKLDYIRDEDQEPVEGGVLTFGLNAETDGWNPATSRWSTSGYIVGNTIFDPMAVYDEAGQPIPYLLESFSSNEDFTVWTLTTREGPTFHDGTAVDADALVKNLSLHQQSILTSAAMSQIDEIVKVDSRTVEIRCKEPWSTLPLLFVSQVGYVMAPSMMDAEAGAREPVGSGPFTFQNWVPNSKLKVKKNESYWREGLPYLAEIEFTVYADVQTRGRAFDTGEMDVIESGDARQIVKYTEQASAGEVQMFSDENAEQAETFIALNTTKPPFDDPLARQILAYGVDRQGLANAAYDGVFKPAFGMFSEGSPWYAEVEGVPNFDLAKATALHEEYKAKYGRPLSFTANITPSPEIQLIAQTLQQQAADAGVEVKLNAIDQATLISDAVTRNYEATGFILFGAPDPEREYPFLADDPEGSFLNITGNANPRIVEAIHASRASDDPAKRKEAWTIIQQEQAKDLNFIWLVHNLAAIVFSNSVYGLADATTPDGTRMLRTMNPMLTETFLVGG